MGLMLHAAARTDAGRRANNEDSVFASPRLAAVADGVGGAEATKGSGLRGLADRVAALDGTLSLDSPPGRGTRLRVVSPVDGGTVLAAEMPCEVPTAAR